MQEKIKASQYEMEIPHADALQCLHGFQDSVEFVDNGVSTFQSCPSQEEIEEQLTQLVSNRWETGQIWGDFFANMFQGSIDAP